MKIIIFHCAFIYTGGGERIAFGQIDGLKKRGYDVRCFVPVIDRTKCYPDIINQYPVSTLLPGLPAWVPFRHGLGMLATCLLAPLLVRRFGDADLFIGENQPGTWLAFVASKILGKPYLVYTCHPNKILYPRRLSRDQLWKNQTDFYWLSLLLEPFKWLVKKLDKASFTSSGRPVLINGFFIGREFCKIYQTEWTGCPSGAPFLKSRQKVTANHDVFQGEIAVGSEKIAKPYLLYVGRHEVWKRVDLAIKAFEKIIKKYPDIRLVIRGPFSEHTKDLQKLVEKMNLTGKVIFSPETGDQSGLKKLYFNAAAYVFPSKKEDFGIVIIEAMGAGVPVVAWNRGGPTDIVVDGQTGYLAKPYDLDDFAAKALKIINSKKLRHRMSLASWQRVKDEFSWENHLDILEAAIKKSQKRHAVI